VERPNSPAPMMMTCSVGGMAVEYEQWGHDQEGDGDKLAYQPLGGEMPRSIRYVSLTKFVTRLEKFPSKRLQHLSYLLIDSSRVGIKVMHNFY